MRVFHLLTLAAVGLAVPAPQNAEQYYRSLIAADPSNIEARTFFGLPPLDPFSALAGLALPLLLLREPSTTTVKPVDPPVDPVDPVDPTVDPAAKKRSHFPGHIDEPFPAFADLFIPPFFRRFFNNPYGYPFVPRPFEYGPFFRPVPFRIPIPYLVEVEKPVVEKPKDELEHYRSLPAASQQELTEALLDQAVANNQVGDLLARAADLAGPEAFEAVVEYAVQDALAHGEDVDRNGDGQIDRNEFYWTFPELDLYEEFGKLDINNDGFISIDEL